MLASKHSLDHLLKMGIGSYTEEPKKPSNIIIREGSVFKDLILKKFDVLCTGMNCFNAMGVGPLKALSKHYPGFSESDFASGRGNESKLGHTSAFRIPSGVYLACLYIQFGYGKFKNIKYQNPETGHINLNFLESSIREVFKRFPNKKIALTQPGVGNNGTSLELILPTIERVLLDLNKTLILYKVKKRESPH
jgi:hypothetical protein